MVSRRGILAGAAIGGGLMVAYALIPRSFPLPLEPRDGEWAFGAWLKIGKDGLVSVAVPQLEMGQGITTLLPQIAAMELGADWRQVAVEPAPPSGAYANVPLAAKWADLWMPALAGMAKGEDPAIARNFAERNRFNVTAEGTSIAAYEQPLRVAAAAAREMLARVAADRWDIDPTECKVEGGFVTHGKQRFGFGQLAEEAASLDPPSAPVLRGEAPNEKGAGRALGTPNRYPRLDGPSKVMGSANFAGDVRLPDMVHAAVAHGPVGDTRLVGYSEKRIEGLSGDIRLVRGDGWLAAVASNWWAANRALEVLSPQFATRNGVESDQTYTALDKAVKKAPTERILTEGDPDGAIGGKPTVIARYDVSPALHGTLETASCTARLRDGTCELWLATQAPQSAREAVAEALGINAKDVILYPVPAGGSFDARLDHRHAVQAALVAKEVGKPVQLTWSRWQEHLAALPRTPAAAVLWARLAEPGGQVLGWKTRIAVPATGAAFGRRLFEGENAMAAMRASDGEADPMAVEGAVPPYGLGNFSLDHVAVVTGLPAGRMRGQAHGYTAFFTECFIDELAHAAKREPLSYRMEMLGDDPRLAACLLRVSSLANWNGGNDASGQGLACHRIGSAEAGGRIAVIVTARRDAEGGVLVDRISAAVDIGRVINRDIARQQLEGGLIYGLGLAAGSSTSYAEGVPYVGKLSGLGLPLLAQTPAIEIDLLDSTAPPADPGELGVAAIAPAIANALFSATGFRFRRLPLLEYAE
ncbi:molybdopterin cofactor-binding domain-containing protein [Novosphingobium sp. TH158]|uniref:molybdopterin cofactor-binding domain-containing protein n=1 Tax=Novosphingobium sp. TH158 TaxID=2067455 RepID=UPI000C7C9B50|nr:molybdopterin cofactor-binding domain-containing protein [Novosphingobium sp. TH158]PLK24425.1 xanthine dehydrogenase [Novosphingobium sp. TH158]